jgi:hypothetical protein
MGREGRFFEAKDFDVDNRCEEQAQTSQYTTEEARSGVARPPTVCFSRTGLSPGWLIKASPRRTSKLGLVTRLGIFSRKFVFKLSEAVMARQLHFWYGDILARL